MSKFKTKLENGGNIKLTSDATKHLFSKQKELLRRYAQLGFVPDTFEGEISIEHNQNFIKEVAFNISMEFSELMWALDKFYNIPTNGQHVAEATQLMYDLNEEIADILHFTLELLIYLGIDNEALIEYYTEVSTEEGYEGFINIDAISSAFSLENMKWIQRGYAPARVKVSKDTYTVFNDNGNNLNKLAFRYTNLDLLYEYRVAHSNFINQLNTVCYKLNTKHWRKGMRKIHEDEVKLEACKTFSSLVSFLLLTFIEPLALNVVYLAKNEINHKRIDDKY